MNCPHCTVAFHDHWTSKGIGSDSTGSDLVLNWTKCPACSKWVVRINSGGSYLVWPRNAARPVHADVPEPYCNDFKEASAVLTISPKASAALSRRLLQHVLVEKGKATRGDLIKQIEQLMPTWPSYLKALHAIRVIGNFAAHPSKDTNTGTVVDVEPGEAEWLLDMLEHLFDYYFVQPAATQRQMQQLNAKLKAIGKPEIPLP